MPTTLVFFPGDGDGMLFLVIVLAVKDFLVLAIMPLVKLTAHRGCAIAVVVSDVEMGVALAFDVFVRSRHDLIFYVRHQPVQSGHSMYSLATSFLTDIGSG
jgi:hypothetical protein